MSEEKAIASPSGTHAVGAAAVRGESCRRLTDRETQILDLVARGLTNGAIGHHLHISSRTVEAHLARTFAKLAASNRTEAAMLAFGRFDVLPAGPPTT